MLGWVEGCALTDFLKGVRIWYYFMNAQVHFPEPDHAFIDSRTLKYTEI